MLGRFIIYSIVVSFLLLVGCKMSKTEEELQAYINNEKNGLVKQKNIGDVTYKVIYKPTDLIVAQFLAQQDKTNHAKIDSLRRRLEKYYYFLVSISRNQNEVLATAKSTEEMNNEMMELMFHMGQYITATAEKDTLLLVDYIYPRMYGASRSTDLLFVFEREKPRNKAKEIIIAIDDIGMGVGLNKFIFDRDDLVNSPTLQF